MTAATVTADAEELLRAPDLLELGMRASEIRARLHGNTVGYCTSAVIRLSDSCAPDCAACSVWGESLSWVGSDETQSVAVVRGRAAELRADGISEVVLHAQVPGGLATIEETARALTTEGVAVHGLSCSEVQALSVTSGDEVIDRLAAAGVKSLLCDASAIGECGRLHRKAKRAGLDSVVLFEIDSADPLTKGARRISQLIEAQEQTEGAFVAVMPFIRRRQLVPHANAQANGAGSSSAELHDTAVDYLRMIASLRVASSAIPHIVVPWTAQGVKTQQMALRFGADDLGGAAIRRTTSIEGVVADEEELRRLIRAAGFYPARRDFRFRTYYRF